MQSPDLPRSKSFVPPAFTLAQTTLDKKRVAILPLQSISPDPKDEYFADGLTEELISTMSKIGGLKVVARTSVMVYKGQQKKIGEIARELKAGTILEGSVRKAGDKLRITAQLIDSESSDHLWAESYDREMKDVFAIQSEISQIVAEALKVKLLPAEKDRVDRKPTDNIEAYESYLRGLETSPWIKSGYRREDIEMSREYFERAVELDPKFALAYAGLEACYMEAFAYKSWKERFPKAEAAARKALEIDGDLPESHLAYADVLAHSYDLRGFEREVERAIELNPNSAQAHFYLAVSYMLFNRFEDAYAEMRRARELDPLSSSLKEWMGSLLIRNRQYDRALEYFSEMLREHETADLHDTLAFIHFLKGDYDKAWTEAQAALAQADVDERPYIETTVAFIYAKSGRKAEAFKILKELKEESEKKQIPPRIFARIYSATGENERAVQIFEKAYEEHDDLLPWIITSPQFDDLRSDPRFTALRKKVGLE